MEYQNKQKFCEVQFNSGVNRMFFILLLIGVLAGVLAGLLGLGGGILFTPVFFYLFTRQGVSDPVLWSVGSSLFCTFVASISSVIRQIQQLNFFLREGLLLGLLGSLGVYLGRLVLTSGYYREQEFVIFFSTLLLYVAYRFLKSGFDRPLSPSVDYRAPGWQTLIKRSSAAGLLGGFVASLAGIGGGSVMVPIMNLRFKIPIKKTVSISSTAIVLISLSGWAQIAVITSNQAGLTAYTLGHVDFGAALPLVVGATIGGFAGAWLSNKISQKWLAWLFALLAVSISIKLIVSVF